MKIAEESLKKVKLAMKKRWDTSKREEESYQAGDQVLVQAKYLPSNRSSRKLDDKWRGPFKVLTKKGESAYKLELPPTWKGHCILNMSRLKKFHLAVFPGQAGIGSRPDPVITTDRKEEFKVEEILEQ
jgi:hypothetical protein